MQLWVGCGTPLGPPETDPALSLSPRPHAPPSLTFSPPPFSWSPAPSTHFNPLLACVCLVAGMPRRRAVVLSRETLARQTDQRCSHTRLVSCESTTTLARVLCARAARRHMGRPLRCITWDIARRCGVCMAHVWALQAGPHQHPELGSEGRRHTGVRRGETPIPPPRTKKEKKRKQQQQHLPWYRWWSVVLFVGPAMIALPSARPPASLAPRR